MPSSVSLAATWVNGADGVFCLSCPLDYLAHPDLSLGSAVAHAFEELNSARIGPRRVDESHPDPVIVHPPFHLAIEV
jgi:hypothetical protein